MSNRTRAQLRLAIALAVAAASATGLAPALAQTDVVVGVGGTLTPARVGPRVLTANGYGPAVAIGEDGTTHVAWGEPRDDFLDAVRYCRVPRPGGACVDAETFTPAGHVPRFPEWRYGGGDVRSVFVLTPRPDEVVIIAARQRSYPLRGIDVASSGTIGVCGPLDPCHDVVHPVFAYISHDGGANFEQRVIANAIGGVAAAASLTVDAGTPDERDLILLLDPQEDGLTVTSTRSFTEPCTDLSGPGITGDELVDEASLGIRDHDVVLALSRPEGVSTRRFGATPGATGTQVLTELCTAGRWSPWAMLPGTNTSARLASGTRGTFLLSYGHGDLRSQWAARDVTTTDSGPATELGRPHQGLGAVTLGDIAQDGLGNVTAAWVEPRIARSEIAGGHDLLLARANAGGPFLAATTLQGLDSLRDMRGDTERVDLATIDDGGGAVVYQHHRRAGPRGPRSISLLLFGTRAARPVDDVHIAGAEITQGVQVDAPLQRDRANPSASLAYPGPGVLSARLVQGRQTVVRAYVTVRRALAAGATPPPVQMRVLRDGTTVSTLFPTPPRNTPPIGRRTFGPPIGDAFEVPAALHQSVGREYTFVVPPVNDFASYAFEIEANPAGALPAYPECARCRGFDNFLRLGPQRFFRPTTVNLLPIEMAVGLSPMQRVRGAATGPETIFATTRILLPVNFNIPPYQGFYNIGDIARDDATPEDRADDARDLVEDWADDTDNDRSGLFPIGVFPADSRNFNIKVPGAKDGFWMRGGKLYNHELLDPASCTLGDCVQALYQDRQPIAVLSDSGADVLETAHEIVHGLGFKHAGTDRRCYAEEEQVGLPWPPGSDGRIDGIGLDTRDGTPPFVRVVSRPSSPKTTVYDLMSYCATQPSLLPRPGWLSVHNWNRISGYFAPAQAATLQRAAPLASDPASATAAGSLLVSATVPPTGAGARIVRVRPDDHAPVARSGVSRPGPYAVVARNRAGAVLLEAATERFSNLDANGAADSLRAFVPATGVDRVEVVRVSDRAVLATRSASRRAPTVRITSPRPRATIGRQAQVELRWSARDPDGDRLQAWVDYAADGRTFRPVGYQENARSLKLPASLFRRASRARLRVRVNDGFRESAATVGPIRALGAPPRIDVIAPRARARGRADSSITLQAIAYDDANRELPDAALRWKLGRRTLLARGTGGALLPAGRVKLAVDARDRFGRVTTHNVLVRVAGAPPRFTRLTGPSRVQPKARKVTLRVAGAFPSVLRVQGRRIPVGRTPVNVVVRLPRRGAEVRIPLVLSSGERTLKAAVVVVRR